MENKEFDVSLFRRIWSAAERSPLKIIIKDCDREWTWSDLLWQSQAYADAIQSASSIDDFPIVPIFVDRRGETVAAILGTLIARRAFAPLSLLQPVVRLNHCLLALKAEFFIACGADVVPQNLIAHSQINPIGFDDPIGLPIQPAELCSADTMYVLFTSGSTGVPKGVVAECGNIENTMQWSTDMLDWHGSDVIGCCTNFFFDISMFDVFTCLYFDVPIGIYSSPNDVLSVLEETQLFQVTSIFGVPTFFSQLFRHGLIGDDRLASLRRIIAGGDFFPPAHVLGWLTQAPKVDVFNVWGPTETSIVNTMHRIDSSDIPALEMGRSAPVGREHSRMHIRLIDERGQLLKQHGERGEICMLGACVTRGYLNDVEKTSYAYIELDNERAFRTQDMGYLDEKGNLFIIGRVGATVKIAGYRIDLGEVEAAAVGLPGIHLACGFVVGDDDSQNPRELCMAIEPENIHTTLDIFTIKKGLRAVLPNYMVPKRIFVFPNLPRNANGKIDRNAVYAKAKAEMDGAR